MNNRVLKSMLNLTVVFLVSIYALKFIIPDQFVIDVENPVLVEIGNYIDAHPLTEYTFGIITAFATYWFYLCAVCKQWYLNLEQSIIVLIVVILSIGATHIDLNLYAAMSYTSFIFLPALFGAKMKETWKLYTIHIVSQYLTMTIRSLPIYLNYPNTLIIFILALDHFTWLLVFYFYYNIKEVRLWDGNCHQSTDVTSSDSKTESQASLECKSLWQKIKLIMKRSLQKKEPQQKHQLRLISAIRDFFTYDFWIYLIVIGSIALCSWIFNRWIEGIMLCVAHVCIRRVFNKQFHFNAVAYCLALTLGIIWFAIPITLPVSISVLSSIPLAFIICYLGFIAQDRVDLIAYTKSLISKIDNPNVTPKKSIYAMNPSELYEHCRACGLDEEECKIAKLIVINRLKGQALYQAINYSERQSKRKRKSILDRIK